MKRFLFSLLLVAFSSPFKAENLPQKLSPDATISLLTLGAGDEIHTLFGHTALRICDTTQLIDYVFNYGCFDFNQPYFIYNFTRGETDYFLSVERFPLFLLGSVRMHRSLREQVLNLTQREKENLWQRLLENLQPQNRTYRYNFLSKNCSTSPKEIIQKSLEGKIVFPPQKEQKTFRELLYVFSQASPWTCFGTDLILGNRIDRKTSKEEEMFLPEFLFEGIQQAQIEDSSSHQRPLVSEVKTWIEEERKVGNFSPISPMFCGWGVILITLLISLQGWSAKRSYKGFDLLFYGIYGIAGCLLFFLILFSELPAMRPNWNGLWLMPFHLLVPMLIFRKNVPQILKFYYVGVIICVVFFYIICSLKIQSFNPNVHFFVLALLIRSTYHLLIIQGKKSKTK